MKKLKVLLLLAIIVIIASSFTQNKGTKHNNSAAPKITKAVCVMYPTKGNTASGTITFTQTADGIKVVADMQNLTPGKHGIHIHECGDCTAADAMSAAGHFNPKMTMHGSPSTMTCHGGDLGNITADENGKAHLEITSKMMSFEGEMSIIGRSVIVHKSEDDMTTQPTGNSGARVACGVIGITK